MNNLYVDYLALEDVKVGDEVGMGYRRGSPNVWRNVPKGIVPRRRYMPLLGFVVKEAKKGEMAKVMVSGSIPVFVADNIVHAGRAVYLTGHDRLVKIKPRWMPRAVWRRVQAWFPAQTRLAQHERDLNPAGGVALQALPPAADGTPRMEIRIGGGDE